MHSVEKQPKPFRSAPRCGAKTRSGSPCMSPAVSGKARCRMHGGAKGSGAPKGQSNGSFKHGLWTAEAAQLRRECRLVLELSRESLKGAR
ncbi:HGGxSTG domain-containing protein [Methylobacterium isbiliense]|uniref:HGGxSTG domain-containing protein n=1 Tax=Methylobacterium isbiliense TaxID=315478 RepID=UPI0024B4B6DC|nr:HGGxSTG domain-containing protein [Methylobacterium isbiliense]MDN3624478.1 HGGxSTG domain-containing protein [Methylobacterium isbiliense]